MLTSARFFKDGLRALLWCLTRRRGQSYGWMMSRKVEPTLPSLTNLTEILIMSHSRRWTSTERLRIMHLKPEARSSSAIQEAVVIPCLPPQILLSYPPWTRHRIMQSLEGIFVVEMERAQVRVLLPALLVLLTQNHG